MREGGLAFGTSGRGSAGLMTCRALLTVPYPNGKRLNDQRIFTYRIWLDIRYPSEAVT